MVGRTSTLKVIYNLDLNLEVFMKVLANVFSLLLILPVAACASYPSEKPPENISDFQYPKSGVFVVPSSAINIPSEFKKKIQNNLVEMKTKGYYNSISTDAQNLMANKNVNLVALQSKGKSDINDTNMKSSIAEVGLAFPYPGIPNIDKNNVIGYAAGGMLVENKGWTGIKEFFNDPELGTCNFFLSNMALSHGNVRIGEDSVQYVVNKKAGTTEVYGSNSTGFTYNLSWYDDTYSHELECATPKFSKATIKKMITLAKEIDEKLTKSLH
jgi:hypothetical protein